MTEGQNPPAGWYPDPHQPGSQRYWDGDSWTEHVRELEPARAQPRQKSKPTKHKLGRGSGAIIDSGDGTVLWTCMSPQASFRLRVADISGFSVTSSPKLMESTFNIFGNGTTLASVSVLAGTPRKIETWLRSHPDFAGGVKTSPAETSAANQGLDLTDQIARLAALHDQGVLTDDEFSAMKARLLT